VPPLLGQARNWRVSVSRSKHAVVRLVEGATSVGLLAGLVLTVLLVRGAFARPQAAVGAATTPTQAMGVAASALEAAWLPGAGGVTFEVVQRSTMHAKPAGPKIEIPDPSDRYKSLGFADEYYVGALLERGAVTPAGFWMEMRTGPAKDAQPDWEAPYQFGAIARDGKTWRNDGEGWYETDSPPGIGLDPKTASLLPRLLRNATGPTEAGIETVDGEEARKLTADGRVADIPGVVAADGLDFTVLAEPLELSFDDLGRLVKARVVARNTNMTDYDLIVETVITLRYPLTAAALPEPSPTRPAGPAEVKP
jgi:hypothetical protein